jgi:hypothetical protein
MLKEAVEIFVGLFFCTSRDPKGCPGAVASAHPPPKEAPHSIKCFSAEKDGFPRFGDSSSWRGRLGGGNPKGETKAGEERHGDARKPFLTHISSILYMTAIALGYNSRNNSKKG